MNGLKEFGVGVPVEEMTTGLVVSGGRREVGVGVVSVQLKSPRFKE